MPELENKNFSDAALEKAMEEWFAQDQNEKTIQEIKQLQQDGDFITLRKLLLQRMEFGTAGLRARMGAGFSQMNDLTILQTTQGLCRYLQEQFDVEELKTRGVVVGHDHRFNSEKFAELTSAVFIDQGIKVYCFKEVNPTPLVPFTLCTKNACCGIMVTASHNPKQDNGYKVYWENGAQITAPHNLHIAEHILKNLNLWRDDWWGMTSFSSNPKSYFNPEKIHSNIIQLDEEMNHKYLEMVKQTAPENCAENKCADLKIVYTAMHGVGTAMVERTFETLKLPQLVKVIEQCTPDPEFPTVAFPNPEEGKSALKLAMKTAEGCEGKYIIANDPDADRSAVAQQLPNGTWKVFNGNETACFFAWWVWFTHQQKQRKRSCEEKDAQNKNTGSDKQAMVASTVSSKFIKSMGQKEGFLFEETLTGFKWIANKALDLQNEGYEVLFGYEEAIGFMVGLDVPDKDGLKALGTMGNIIHYLHSNGSSLAEKLNDLYRTYGYFVSSDSYFICQKKETIQTLFYRLRHKNCEDNGEKVVDYTVNDVSKFNYVTTCGPYEIESIRDCTFGLDNGQADGKAKLPIDATVEMLTFTFKNGAVITVRTSGTEPKIKYYSEMHGNIEKEEDKLKVENELKDLLKYLVSDFFQPERNELIWRVISA